MTERFTVDTWLEIEVDAVALYYDIEVDVEVEIEPGGGDGWNEPRYGPSGEAHLLAVRSHGLNAPYLAAYLDGKGKAHLDRILDGAVEQAFERAADRDYDYEDEERYDDRYGW